MNIHCDCIAVMFAIMEPIDNVQYDKLLALLCTPGEEELLRFFNMTLEVMIDLVIDSGFRKDWLVMRMVELECAHKLLKWHTLSLSQCYLEGKL